MSHMKIACVTMTLNSLTPHQPRFSVEDKDKSNYVPAKAIETEAANNKDDDNPEQQRVAQQETGGEIIVGIDSNDTTATGKDKSDYKSAEAIKSDTADNKKRSADEELGGKKRKKGKKQMGTINVGINE